MRLIIGGRGQGKLDWYRKETGMNTLAADGANVGGLTIPSEKIWNHLHLWVKACLQEGGNPAGFLEKYCQEHEDAVIICDEIGCGVVPISASEREWREVTGRLCCSLAQRAQRVDRVFCGIGQTIKAEEGGSR